MFEKIPEEVRAFTLKTIIPALVAISIKLAVQAKEQKVTLLQVVISFICGMGCAYLFSEYIDQTFSHPWHSVAIAVVAISGEKIGHFLVHKINVEKIILALIEKLFPSKK